MSDKYTMHVISHTHWDREWWSSFQHFRMRLVDFTDHLLDLMESNPEFKYFHFDGQTILLEDYLEIRPENEQRLRKLVKEGRILIGPWYMQPDEFLVSGESLIRNIMLGRAMGDDWGNWMPVGYVPDCFGHVSQFPQLLRGFGIDNAVLFRGITTDRVKSEFLWESPDESVVLCVKMPDNNAYSNWFYRLKGTLTSPDAEIDFEQSRKEVADLLADSIREKPTTSHVLFMDGCDHVFANPKTPEIIRDVNENTSLGQMLHTTLPQFLEALRTEDPDLDTVEGELRCGNRCWMLQGILPNVHSSRIHLKQANHEIQTLLEKWTEPFSTIAWRLGKEYPSSYLALAWKYLLKNQPHDSICGCSIDQVHKDMVYRYDQARMIAQPLAAESLKFIADKVDTSKLLAPRSKKKQKTNAESLPASDDAGSIALVVFNPLSWERSEAVEAEVQLPPDWNAQSLAVLDEEGNEVNSKVLESHPDGVFAQEPYNIPQHTPTKKFKLLFMAEDVPSVGYKTFHIKALATPNRIPGSLITGVNIAQNEYLMLQILANGSLAIYDKESEQLYSGGMVFEDGGDFGDGWTYRKPMVDTIVTSSACRALISVVEDNPLRTTFKVETVMPVPASAHANGRERSTNTSDLRITSWVSLAESARRVDIVTEVENTARDHRLRVLFPSEIDTDISDAESIFHVVARSIKSPECRDWKEPMTSSHPQKSFVDISDRVIGLAIINESLPEYEVMYKNRTVAVSLLRSVGNGVGGPEAQTQGQMIGTHRFRYSVYPHEEGWFEARVWQEAWAHNVPMRAIPTGIHDGDLPMSKSFLSLGSDRIVLSALKKTDSQDETVVRVFNIRDYDTSCEMQMDGVRKLTRADLNEQPIDDIPVEDGVAELDIGAHEIVTFLAKGDVPG